MGYPFKTCRGPGTASRYGLHDWGSDVVEDILVHVDAYHLYDRLRKRITHEERFPIPSIPAVIELSIQAGVDLPEYPAKRRRKAIIRIKKNEFIDADESDLPDLELETPKIPILTEIPKSEVVPPSSAEEIVLFAEETLLAWERMRQGANKLMKMYPVRVCGYCVRCMWAIPGIKCKTVEPTSTSNEMDSMGGRGQFLMTLYPQDMYGMFLMLMVLRRSRNFEAFMVRHLQLWNCVFKLGAAVPEQYTPTMRLDIGIPGSIEEAEKVV